MSFTIPVRDLMADDEAVVLVDTALPLEDAPADGPGVRVPQQHGEVLGVPDPRPERLVQDAVAVGALESTDRPGPPPGGLVPRLAETRGGERRREGQGQAERTKGSAGIGQGAEVGGWGRPHSEGDHTMAG